MYGSSPTPEEKAVEDAILANSPSQLSVALERAIDSLGSDVGASQELLDSALKSAVEKGKIAPAEYLINEGADVSTLSVLDVAHKPSIALWSALKSEGYDFDQFADKDSIHKGRSVIYKVTHEESLVRWLIEECGVRIDLGEEDYWHEPRPPLLLQTCASLGSVACFKLIKERGAKVGRRTLHEAVKAAAINGCDPELSDKDTPGKKLEGATKVGAECGLEDLPLEKHKRNREEMLRYLVDELHLDVNAMDTEDEKIDGLRKPSSRGRPLDYAVGWEPDEDRASNAVLRWLVKKGADPNIALRKFDSAD